MARYSQEIADLQIGHHESRLGIWTTKWCAVQLELFII